MHSQTPQLVILPYICSHSLDTQTMCSRIVDLVELGSHFWRCSMTQFKHVSHPRVSCHQAKVEQQDQLLKTAFVSNGEGIHSGVTKMFCLETLSAMVGCTCTVDHTKSYTRIVWSASKSLLFSHTMWA